MNWNNLSLKQKADIIKMSVQSGITDLSEIQQLYNSSQKGDGGLLDNIGDAVTTSARWVDRNIITPTSNVLSAIGDPRGTAYAIMVGNNEDQRTQGSNRDINDVKYAINNRASIVRNRGNIDRNLASLYIYGNDLGQFREAPELVPYGIEYNNYLRSIGRDPSKVKTYEGNFNAPTVVLPQGSQDRLRDYILSKNNKTFYVQQDPENTDFETTDDVNNYTRRFSINSKGEPIIVNSDLWDFEPNSYSTNNATPQERTNAWLKSKALDYIGNPFILKQVDPIEYIDIDTFYNMYNELPQESIEASRGMGYLPEFTFTSTRPTKKALGGQVLRKNKFGEGGTIEPVDYETPWGITTRSRYRGEHTVPTSAIYFKSKEDRDTYAAQQDIGLYGGVLPELEVTAKGVPTQDILTEGLDKNERNPVNLIDPNGSIVLRGITVTPQSAALNRSRRAKGPNADFSNAQDMTWIQQLGATYLAGAPIIDIDPHTCVNTVTGFYDPNNTVASNVNIATNPERYGYREIPQSEAIPGDLIILSNSNGHPNHAVMFDEVSNGYGISNNGYPVAPGDTLVNYSNGGRSSDNYRLQEPLKRFDDPKSANGDFLGPRIYLRYTGKREKK